MIEKGIKIKFRDFKDIKLLVEKTRRYQWIYTGSEFCENLIDIYVNIDKVLNIFKDKKICFLTPVITDKYMDKLLKTVEKIYLSSDKGFEVSVNDFGTLNALKTNFPDIKMNIGRHLAKHFFYFKKNAIKFHTEFSIIAAKDFEIAGINRYDISSYADIPKNNFYKAKKLNFKLTMFYPYVLLSTTRTCLTGIKDIKPEEDIEKIKCKRECLYCDYLVKSDKIEEELVISENSTFIKSDFKNSFLSKFSKINVDRFVYCPSP